MNDRYEFHLTCEICGKKFINFHKTRFCCRECQAKNDEKIDWPDFDELKNMVWSTPRERLCEKLGVSPSAIVNRCKKLNIPVPGVEYWNRLRSRKKKSK